MSFWYIYFISISFSPSGVSRIRGWFPRNCVEKCPCSKDLDTRSCLEAWSQDSGESDLGSQTGKEKKVPRKSLLTCQGRWASIPWIQTQLRAHTHTPHYCPRCSQSKMLNLPQATVPYPNLKAGLTCALLGDTLPNRLLPSRLTEKPLFWCSCGSSASL